LNGEYKYYYESGQLEEKCYYVDDKKNGECELYYETGQLKNKYYYI
jgi:antitoxin component YwqK of YwqJK toxin-antitoxin module